MAKEVSALIKLQIKGGAANPSPPGRTCIRFERCKHHGVLQAIQCSYAG
jgi:ribosomal protein L11